MVIWTWQVYFICLTWILSCHPNSSELQTNQADICHSFYLCLRRTISCFGLTINRKLLMICNVVEERHWQAAKVHWQLTSLTFCCSYFSVTTTNEYLLCNAKKLSNMEQLPRVDPHISRLLCLNRVFRRKWISLSLSFKFLIIYCIHTITFSLQTSFILSFILSFFLFVHFALPLPFSFTSSL